MATYARFAPVALRDPVVPEAAPGTLRLPPTVVDEGREKMQR
ncbi:hypothetical protein ACFWFF_29070 [Streptomyces sp. NPDC060223]